jgi:hypothetical protein
MKYSWTQPCCDECWEAEVSPSINPRRLKIGRETEICVYCGLWTQSGIYIRIDPDAALYPSLKKE